VHCSLSTEKLEYARLNSTGETNAEYNFPRQGKGGGVLMFKNFVKKKLPYSEFDCIQRTICQQFCSPADPQHLSVGFYVKSACKNALSG